MTQTILHIDASARYSGSLTRALTTQIVAKIGGDVVRRDLAQALPLIDEAWVAANFTPADQRTSAQNQTLALSDSLIAEIKAADVLVIGVPVYNFGVPAALKAWIDQIARAGVTFKYTPDGPKGLMEGKRAILAMASGGVEIGSDTDFASGYMRHVMGFIGIQDVQTITANKQGPTSEAAIDQIATRINAAAA